VHRLGQLFLLVANGDQREFKQTVIRGYARHVSLARPWVNVAAKLLGTPRLPAIGSTLAHAFVSPLATVDGRGDVLLTLVEQALEKAAARGLEFVTLGFGAGDWRLEFIRQRFRSREYRTRIYYVSWDEDASASNRPDPIISPEVALL